MDNNNNGSYYGMSEGSGTYGASEGSGTYGASENASSYGAAGGNGSYSYYEEPKPKKEKKKGGFGGKLIRCVALAIVFGLVSGSVFYGTGYVLQTISGGKDTNTAAQKEPVGSVENGKVTVVSSTETSPGGSDVSQVVEAAMPSMVSITSLTVQQVNTFWGTMNRETPGAGSGIIVAQTEEELFIATNNHVVANTTDLTVRFVDDATVKAEIKGTDSGTDLAVVSVKMSDISAETLGAIKVATLGDSSSLRLGERAIAIGNAMGYGQSVTVGYISALSREVTVDDGSGNAITNELIQTDAAINPGNSGGALLNVNGDVIGINSVKYADTDVEGMGYAIPISTAEPIINDLITRREVAEADAAFLGIQNGVDVTSQVSKAYNMPMGIYVSQVVPGSAAEKAGILKGDIITAFDGREVLTWEALLGRIKYYAAGDTVDVTLQSASNGEYQEKVVTVTLGRKN